MRRKPWTILLLLLSLTAFPAFGQQSTPASAPSTTQSEQDLTPDQVIAELQKLPSETLYPLSKILPLLQQVIQKQKELDQAAAEQAVKDTGEKVAKASAQYYEPLLASSRTQADEILKRANTNSFLATVLGTLAVLFGLGDGLHILHVW